MTILRVLHSRFCELFDKDRRERELAAELESHVQLHVDDGMRAGLSPDEARRQALLMLGGMESAKEAYRDRRGLPWFEHALKDVRFTLRQFKKSPGFALVCVLTLAVGIGSTTSVFTIANAVLFRSAPYPDPDRLVLIWGDDPAVGDQRGQVSFTNIEDVRRRNRVFGAVANFADWTPTLSADSQPERLAATQVGEDFFDVIGVKPQLGRAFTPEEQIDGNDRVVILSHQLWRRRFASDPSIVGKFIRLSSVPHTIVGVMPEDFEGLPSTLVQGGELYRPIGETYDNTQRSAQHLRAIARLKPGVTQRQAQQDVTRIARELEAEFPQENHALRYHVASFYDDTVRELRPSVLLLFGAVLTLLLVACTNLAGLLLARGRSRQREIALRSAIGASRSRLLMQSITENVVLATIGGTLGMAIAFWVRDLARALSPDLGSPLAHAAIDFKVIVFAVAATVITAVLFGIAPALRLAGVNLSEALKQGSQCASATREHRQMHGGLIIAELALALVLLSVGGLLIRSLVQLQNVDIGFEPQNRLVANVWLPWARYQQPERSIAFYTELLRRVRGIAGVANAAIVHNPPLGNFDGRGILPEGREDRAENVLSPQAYFVSSEYLQTMGIGLLRGRNFSDADGELAGPVVMVSELLGKLCWPGEDPVGKHIQMRSGAKSNGQYVDRTVVGVVADLHHFGADQTVKPAVYLPFRQFPVTFMTLVVHSKAPMAIVPDVRREVAALDPEIAMFSIGTYEEFLSKTMLLRRLSMLLVGTFSLLALFQAALGLYGLMSYAVVSRQREFGVRAALGARPQDLLRMVVSSAVRMLFAGSIIGIVLALIAGRAAASLLFGIHPADVVTLVASLGVLTTVGLLASYLPARSAAHTDPTLALRAE